MLLLRSFFRLKELFQVKNGLTTLLLSFFFENAKNLGRLGDTKRRKKRGWPKKIYFVHNYYWSLWFTVSSPPTINSEIIATVQFIS